MNQTFCVCVSVCVCDCVWSVNVCMYVCVIVCVWERERVCVHAWRQMSVRLSLRFNMLISYYHSGTD